MSRYFYVCFILGCFTKKSRGCPGGNMFIPTKILFYIFDKNLIKFFIEEIELFVCLSGESPQLTK